jgi:hypothetical protein
VAFDNDILNDLTLEMHNELWPGVPEPLADVDSLYKTVIALKLGYEHMARGRGEVGKSALLVEELDAFLSALSPFLAGAEDEVEDITEAIEDLEEQMKAMLAHIKNSSIHFADAPAGGPWVRITGQWVPIPDVVLKDVFDDNIISTELGWTSHKINQELEGKLDADAPVLEGDLDLNGHGVIGTFIAAEALVPDDLCYLDDYGKMRKTDADDAATSDNLLTICMEPLSAEEEGKFLLRGFHDTSGLATGEILYIDVSSGTWTSVKPSGSGDVIRIVGYAITPSQMFFNPDKTWLELR